MPGMFFSAKTKHNVDMKKSWMIGDSERDIIAANAANIENTILFKSSHEINELNSNAKFIVNSINQSMQLILD